MPKEVTQLSKTEWDLASGLFDSGARDLYGQGYRYPPPHLLANYTLPPSELKFRF